MVFHKGVFGALFVGVNTLYASGAVNDSVLSCKLCENFS